ncbi:hypothetical protein BC628DRAFT_1356810 [Trametes gibbosa]|nr:hypothetical protein BC628DRAFT_1356810 [Trametes gibbosa]
MSSAMSAQLYTTTKQVQDRSRRSWYRLLFYDHLGYIDRLPEATLGRDKVKVWCMKCFERGVANEQRADSLRGQHVRTTVEIEQALWALPESLPPKERWIRSAGASLLVHIQDCDLQDPADRARAQRDHDQMNLSPRRQRRVTTAHTASSAATVPLIC